MIDLKIREAKIDLSMKEQEVAHYISVHKPMIKNMSIQALAKVNGVSTTTILRLCQKLGYGGFRELKVELIASPPAINKIFQEDINIDDSMQMVNHKIRLIEKSSIDETHALINIATLTRANQLISQSNKIVIYGAGSSGLVGKELEYQLIKIKKDVSCHLDYSIQFSTINTLDNNDLVIIISHSGENQESIKLLKLARELGIPSIAMTKMGQSPISHLATVVLHTLSTEHVSRIIPIRSKISQMTMINVLVTHLFIKHYDEGILKQIQTRAERFKLLNNNI